MKVLKILLIVLLVIILLVGGCSYWLYRNFDGFIATAIESAGTELLQTPVQVEDLNFSLSEARVELHGFTIKNFSGFAQEDLFALNSVAIDIDPDSVESEVLIFDELLVDGMHLTLEQASDGHTNVQELKDRLAVHEGEAAYSEETNSGNSEQAPEVRFIIRKLTLSNIAMDVVSPLVESKTYRLDDVVRRDLGAGRGGVTAPQLVEELFQPFMDEVSDALRERVGNELQGLIQDNMSEEDAEQFKALQQRLQESQ